MLTHEKLIVYQRAIELLTITMRILERIPSGNSEIVNQFKRAALSVPLNIAEGAGRLTRSDKQRFFGIARGSALECAAILDVLVAIKLFQKEDFSIAKQLLLEVISMLSVLCRR